MCDILQVSHFPAMSGCQNLAESDLKAQNYYNDNIIDTKQNILEENEEFSEPG